MPMTNRSGTPISSKKGTSSVPEMAQKPTPRLKDFDACIHVQSIPGEPTSIIPPIPGPWNLNNRTVLVVNWHLDTFKTPSNAISRDPADARLGKIIIPEDKAKKLRIVIDFESHVDFWTPWCFEKIKEWADWIKANTDPEQVTVSAYLNQGVWFIGRRNARTEFGVIQDVVKHLDEVSPPLYVNEGWELSRQKTILDNWWKRLAPDKPLSPFIWKMVKGRFLYLCTRNQFWTQQVKVAADHPGTVAVVLWDNIRGQREQRIMETATTTVFNDPPSWVWKVASPDPLRPIQAS